MTTTAFTAKNIVCLYVSRLPESDQYGFAKTKNIYNFYFKIGGENLTMQIQFYTTKNVVDVKMTGNNAMKAAKHPEFGLKNCANYFVDEIMPKFIDYLYNNEDVQGVKDYWGKLAQEGLVQELKKNAPKSKGKGKDGKNVQTNLKSTCGHCDKIIGKKSVVQCTGCKNMNLVECLTGTSKERIRDFTSGKDKFLCRKCVMQVNSNSVLLDDSSALEFEELVDVASNNDTEETNEIDRLESELARKETEYNSLKSKCDLHQPQL